MFYVIWILGVLLTVLLSVVVTISIEKNGELDD